MECSICLEPMERPLYLSQCTHGFHGVCVMKAFETYLKLHGTGWQTVPCPQCRKRISYHIILNTFIKTCTLDEAQQILNDDNVHARCHPDWSLLHVAAMSGKIPIVHYLIERGLDVHEVNCFGHTAVYIAALHGHTELVRYLVERHRVDIHAKTMLQQTARDIAAEYKHHDTVAYLDEVVCRNGPPPSPRSLDQSVVVDTFVQLVTVRLPTI